MNMKYVNDLFCLTFSQSSLQHRNAKANEPCPPQDQLPAMTAVLSDPRLVASLLRCLKAPPPEADGERRNHRVSTTGTAMLGRGAAIRKRGMSFSEEGPSKLAKTAANMSPMVSSMKQKVGSDRSEASFSTQAIAASIFYASLQHIDHWPAPLMHAYAEDAFGPRLWVDRIECQSLVGNLKLAYTGEPAEVNQETLNEAEQVANYYANMMLNIPPEEPPPKSLRASFASLSRSTSLTRQPSDEPAFPEDDSDSGEEEIVEVSMGSVVTSSTSRGGGGDDSSSSGEEEVVMTSAPSFDQSKAEPELDLYPVPPMQINLERIRPRFFGANKELGFAGISNALEGRLEQKSKQNSRLLQALPEFTTIAGVRCLVAKSLEKWLQSPALSGAARILFSTTVQHLQEKDPPLPKDLETIDAILSMQLKANQLNMHIENVTEIAKRIPTATVSRHLFLKILRKEIASMDNASQTREHLQMVSAIHGALSKTLRNDGLAAAILTLLVEAPNSNESSTRRERNQLVRKVLLLLRRLFAALGSVYFDGCGLVESLLSFDFNAPNWTARDEEDKGRVMLECIALHVPGPAEDPALMRGKNMKKFQKADAQNGLSSEEVVRLKKVMTTARKLLITWCVMDYAPLWQKENEAKADNRKKKKHDTLEGAGPPDFSSVLDDEASHSGSSGCPDTMRCVLFMVDPESREMQDFLYPEGAPPQGDASHNDEMHRIKHCYRYGADLDDKMLSIILASASSTECGISSTLALSLIEHLFECCKKGRNADLKVTDPNLVWGMYKLVEYHPEKIPEVPQMNEESRENPDDQFADAEDDMDVDEPVTNGKTNSESASSFPRLARPGLWWRVTSLALIMTGASPDGIGAVIAEQHPTLREIIKMVTSGRYRFPTVDCDDSQRDEMKKGESSMRQQESSAAELLFLPPLTRKESKTLEKTSVPPHGSRVSARQRQRHERALREKREKEAANALVLANKRKRMLKAAQKTIMIWDPQGPARKPPKESVNLILSVERLFGLSETYQKSVNPDLIQAAIGDTSRGAIERAYDWLIPVISAIPSVINRLPASASCFLLLRVYGTESEGNSKLRELSAPLLQHVRKTVTGSFGQEDAIGASNLLLTDVADKKPARRRCARRVLQETLSELNETIEDKSFDEAKCTWLRSLLLVDHIVLLLPDAIQHISDALSRERGRVLRALVLSLDEYIKCAREKEIKGDWNFSASLCDLVSTRYIACAEAMSRFPDLRQLAITVVHEEFVNHLADGAAATDGPAVELVPCRSYKDGKLGSARLPLSLLQSACVLLSIWKESDEGDDASKDLVNELANILMHPHDSPDSLLLEADGVEGVASATMVGSDQPAVSVDEWVMLAKSKSDYIARRAALSAPSKFLPRLLLCSGLPKSSLLTMIDRIGKLGEKSESPEKVYRELLMPSATLAWGFGQIGTRREIARKLVGRLSAYISMGGDSVEKLSDDISFTFIAWLSEECQPPEKPRKGRPLKKAIKAGLASNIAAKLVDAESLLSKITDTDDLPKGSLPGYSSSSSKFFKPMELASQPASATITESGLKDFVMACCAKSDSDTLEIWIKATFFEEQRRPLIPGGKPESHEQIKGADVALLLLNSCVTSETNSEWNRAVERWTPLLSRAEESPKLWLALFSMQESEVNTDCITTGCCESWCPSTSIACRDWILSKREAWGSLDLQRVVSFILQTSGQRATHTPSFQRSTVCQWFEKKETVDGLVALAFECAKQAGQVIAQRNDIAGWLHLLLLIAQSGKREANHMVGSILTKVDEAKHDGLRMLMAEAVLRVYAYFPFNVSLGNPKLRTLLVDACKKTDWRSWRTPLDDTLNDMLGGLKLSPNQRLVHGLVEISKTHPLILLRKLVDMADILENDALAGNRRWSRVRVQGENLQGPGVAVFNGVELKVHIRHWGYSYTDPLWISFIDILLSVPREVLFSCGMGMGLETLLGVYLKLLFVQSTLRDKTARLKARFADLVKGFAKDPQWNTWLASSVPGLDSQNKVRTVLVRCNLITSEQAIENVKANESEN